MVGWHPGLAMAGAGEAPSFDCRKASLPDEKAVCADPQLAKLDRLVAKAYADFTPEFGDKRKIGRGLAADRQACGGDRACIAAVEANALQTYDGEAPDWAQSFMQGLIGEKAESTAAGSEQPLPRTVGQCAATRIKALGTRFGEPLENAEPNAGSAVEFTNGGGQVSYDRDDALAASKRGEPVVTCLVAIPRDCPAGDERGRVYYTLNKATGGAWTLPDASHMCGGA